MILADEVVDVTYRSDNRGDLQAYLNSRISRNDKDENILGHGDVFEHQSEWVFRMQYVRTIVVTRGKRK